MTATSETRAGCAQRECRDAGSAPGHEPIRFAQVGSRVRCLQRVRRPDRSSPTGWQSIARPARAVWRPRSVGAQAATGTPIDWRRWWRTTRRAVLMLLAGSRRHAVGTARPGESTNMLTAGPTTLCFASWRRTPDAVFVSRSRPYRARRRRRRRGASRRGRDRLVLRLPQARAVRTRRALLRGRLPEQAGDSMSACPVKLAMPAPVLNSIAARRWCRSCARRWISDASSRSTSTAQARSPTP